MAAEPPNELPIDEVLPPRRDAAAAEVDATTPEASEISRILARWLDNWIRIPGTHFKIGLDPIVSLLPGVGDFLASSAGLVILLEGVRLRVSVFVLAQMGINMLLNAAMNLIPGLGVIGSAFYKSNSRNLALLNRWQQGHARQVRTGSIFFLVVLLTLIAGIIALWIGLWVIYISLFKKLWNGIAP
jgi:hypothetical protein